MLAIRNCFHVDGNINWYGATFPARRAGVSLEEALKRTKEGSEGEGGKKEPTSTSLACEGGGTFTTRGRRDSPFSKSLLITSLPCSCFWACICNNDGLFVAGDLGGWFELVEVVDDDVKGSLASDAVAIFVSQREGENSD